MANSELSEALKKNWYLLVASAVLVLGGIVYGLTRNGETDENSLASQDTEFQELDGDSPTGQSANENFVKRSSGAGGKGKQGSRLEKEYLAKLEDPNIDDDEYALTLFRLANVYYSSMEDYDSAIEYFEQLIDDYPDYVRTDDAWRYLADCHAKNGDPDLEIGVYNEMLSTFPEGSKQYKWAEEQVQ